MFWLEWPQDTCISCFWRILGENMHWWRWVIALGKVAQTFVEDRYVRQHNLTYLDVHVWNMGLQYKNNRKWKLCIWIFWDVCVVRMVEWWKRISEWRTWKSDGECEEQNTLMILDIWKGWMCKWWLRQCTWTSWKEDDWGYQQWSGRSD